MDSDPDLSSYAEQSRRHRRNTSHGLPQRPQTAKSVSQRWEQLARASPETLLISRPPPHPTRAGSKHEEVSPSAPVTPSSSFGPISNNLLLPQPRSLLEHSSHEDLRRPKSKPTHKAHKGRDGPQDHHNPTLSRRRNTRPPADHEHVKNYSRNLLESAGNALNTSGMTVSKEQTRTPPAPTSDRRRKSSIRPLSTNFSLERGDSPPHYSSGRSRRMLHLMSITQGSVRGRLFFRKDTTGTWSMAQCSINAETGALVSEAATRSQPENVLVQNLRGCRVQTLLDPDFTSAILVLRPLGTMDTIQLRPEDPGQADRWFAALLCWQPVHPLKSLSGQQEHPNPPPPPLASPTGRPLLDLKGRKDPSIIKVSKILYLDSSDLQPDGLRSPLMGSSGLVNEHDPLTAFPWTRVSCMLRDSGELRLYTLASVSTLATVRLPDLTRSSVQRLNPTVFGLEHCLAVCPREAQAGSPRNRSQPLYLGFESRALFEVWFVLLRGFTAPEIYGSGWVQNSNLMRSVPTTPGYISDAGSGLFRIERSLRVQVVEARVGLSDDASLDHAKDTFQHRSVDGDAQHYYIRLLLDGQARGRTTLKSRSANPLWYESLGIVDLPPEIPHAVVQLRVRKMQRNIGPPKLHKSDFGQLTIQRIPQEYSIGCTDDPIAEALLDLRTLPRDEDSEQWLPLLDDDGRPAGEVLLKLGIENDIILMDREYRLLSGILHQAATSLTLQIAEKIPSELSRLAECLLDIYQSSGQATEWLKTLAEEEIDGARKDSSTNRFRTATRHDSDSSEIGGDRAVLVRELNSAAVAEANLLFRGNTLLSKALDCHMKRLGKEYLEETLGGKIREIAEANPDCEVDPTKIAIGAGLQQNWRRLLLWTREIWSVIYESALRCPQELRGIFRHIRACADDHYGERLRSVRYSSVSGFLFLRFFCPAILNPRLFSLLRENPKPNAQRTFMLITKGLQGLANQAFFGSKESWMEPMNEFLGSSKQQFRSFIDVICSISPDQENTPIPSSYSTALAMFTRLPATSREGFPSLPYLIDHTHQFAILVNLWLDNFPNDTTPPSSDPLASLDPDLRQFHNLCLALRKQTQHCLAQLDRSSKRESNLDQKWAAIAKLMEAKPADFWVEPSSNRHPARRDRLGSESNGDDFLPRLDGSHLSASSPLTPGARTMDDDYKRPASALSGLIASSLRLGSAASSEIEQHRPSTSRSSKSTKSARNGDGSVLGLFRRGKKR